MEMMKNNEEKWVREYLVPRLIENGKLIENFSPDNSFELIDVNIKYLGTTESFMLTTCYKLRINYKYSGEENVCYLVVKRTPTVTEDMYNSVNFDSLFHNEITTYTRILPALELSDDFYYPKYYYSHQKELESIIVLSDFSIDGWMMTKDRANLSLEHILLAVKLLGTFHGSCYAFKETNPSKLKELVGCCREPRFNRQLPDMWNLSVCTGIKRCLMVARSYINENGNNERIPEVFLQKLEKLIENHFDYSKTLVEKNVEPLTIFCHGDYLRNNIAFRYNEKEVPIAVTMFDFQTIRYGSPMMDLSTLLCLSAGKDVRCEHFSLIFQAYLDALQKSYREKTNANENFPEFLNNETFLKEYISYLPYALTIAACFLLELHSPISKNVEELLDEEGITSEEIIEDYMTRGGETVDRELAAIVNEMYQLSIKYNVDLFK